MPDSWRRWLRREPATGSNLDPVHDAQGVVLDVAQEALQLFVDVVFVEAGPQRARGLVARWNSVTSRNSW
jgi:hypothetical protein